MSKKIYSIESIRFIAAFAVICIHYFYPKHKELALIVNQWARFAVPFFFVASGYFLGEKLKTNDKPIIYWNFIKKLLILYIGWQLIHFLILPPIWDEIYLRGIILAYTKRLHAVIYQRWDLIIFRGWSQHLWFFFSLAQTALLFFLFRAKRIYWFVGVGLLLWIIGALTKAYAKSKIGIDVQDMGLPKNFNTNNLIFFSSLPFGLGLLLSIKSIRFSLITSFIILLMGYALHSLEIWYLGQIKLKQRVDYVFTTFLVGVGAFLVGLARFKPLDWKMLGNLGKYSLGIYAMHIIVANYLYTYLLWHWKGLNYLLIPLCTLLVSTIISFIMGKIPVIKKLV